MHQAVATTRAALAAFGAIVGNLFGSRSGARVPHHDLLDQAEDVTNH
jgi:hypothetical protein